MHPRVAFNRKSVKVPEGLTGRDKEIHEVQSDSIEFQTSITNCTLLILKLLFAKATSVLCLAVYCKIVAVRSTQISA